MDDKEWHEQAVALGEEILKEIGRPAPVLELVLYVLTDTAREDDFNVVLARITGLTALLGVIKMMCEKVTPEDLAGIVGRRSDEAGLARMGWMYINAVMDARLALEHLVLPIGARLSGVDLDDRVDRTAQGWN